MTKFLNIATEDDEPIDGQDPAQTDTGTGGDPNAVTTTDTSTDPEGGLDDPNGKPNELEKANNMVQNEDSTDPANVVKIANYKEELAVLKEQQQAEGDETTDLTDTSGDSGSSEDTGSLDGDGDGTTSEDAQDPDTTDEDVSSDDENGDKDEGDSKDTSEEVTDEDLTEDDESQLTEATEGYSTLSRLYRVVVSAKERNNLSPVAMEMLNTSIESIKERLGISHIKKYEIPAMEALDGFTARHKQTQAMVVAMEGVLGDVWAAIVRMFSAIIGWISDFFFNKKKSVEGAREDLKALDSSNAALVKGLTKKEELKAKNNGNDPDEVFFSSKEAGYLLAPGVGGTDMEAINKSVALMSKVLNAQSDKIDKVVKNVESVIDDLFKANSMEAIEPLSARSFLSKLLDTSGLEKSTMIKGEDLANFIAFKTPVITLNRGFYYKFVEEQDPKDVNINLMKQQRFGKYDGEDENSGAKIPLIASPKDAVKVVEWLKGIQKTRQENLKEFQLIEKTLKMYRKDIEGFNAQQHPVASELARLLSVFCSIYSHVVLKGYSLIDDTYERYYKLLRAYHTESVKEYGLS